MNLLGVNGMELDKGNTVEFNKDLGIVTTLDEGYNAVSVSQMPWRNNQTRTAAFSPQRLESWAEAVVDIFGDETVVEIAFTPNAPMGATRPGLEQAVCIAPMHERALE